jgi:hypothetical protein
MRGSLSSCSRGSVFCFNMKCVFFHNSNDTLAQSTVAVCPASLYNFCCFLRDCPPGSRAAYVDGTHNLVFDASTFIPFGGMDVQWRRDQSKVTSSYRPWFFLLAPGERKVAFVVLLLLAKKHAKLLFGVDMELDYGESDHADAFVQGYLLVFPGMTPMQCYFHVSKAFKRSKISVAAKFQDKSYIEIARRQVTQLHRCKTTEQHRRCHELMIDAWNAEGEHAAVTHWVKVYGKEPYMNWHYSIAQQPGVYPSGNSNESYNCALKGGKTKTGLVPLNVSRNEFYKNSLAKIFEDMAYAKLGQSIVPPTTQVTGVEVDLVNLMVADRDCFEDPDGGSFKAWFVNTPRAIGKPITQERLARYKAALRGDDKPFTGEDKRPDEVLSHMIDTTNGICRVQQRGNGDIVGDCIHCFKRLSCSCCVLIKNKLGKLGALSVGELDTKLSKRKRGRPQKQNLGGCNPGLPSVEREKDSSLFSKDIQALRKLCKILGLNYSSGDKDSLLKAIVAKGEGRISTGMTEETIDHCDDNNNEQW